MERNFTELVLDNIIRVGDSITINPDNEFEPFAHLGVRSTKIDAEFFVNCHLNVN